MDAQNILKQLSRGEKGKLIAAFTERFGISPGGYQRKKVKGKFSESEIAFIQTFAEQLKLDSIQSAKEMAGA